LPISASLESESAHAECPLAFAGMDEDQIAMLLAAGGEVATAFNNVEEAGTGAISDALGALDAAVAAWEDISHGLFPLSAIGGAMIALFDLAIAADFGRLTPLDEMVEQPDGDADALLLAELDNTGLSLADLLTECRQNIDPEVSADFEEAEAAILASTSIDSPSVTANILPGIAAVLADPPGPPRPVVGQQDD